MPKERDRKRSSSGGKSERGSSRYQSRSQDAYKRRSEQRDERFSSVFTEALPVYAAKDGDNDIRIIGPTWENPEHYGLDVWTHYNVGPDNQQFLCLKKHKGEECPVCEAQVAAKREGDKVYAKALEARKRVAVLIVDRDAEKVGVQLYPMPATIDNDLFKSAYNKRTGETLEIDHPDEGYDVSFHKKGKGINTKYSGVNIARKPSELGNDDWLEVAEENPIPDLLQFYSYDHISDILAMGRGGYDNDDSSDDDDDDDKKSSSRGRSKKSTKKHTWESIHDLDFDGLCDVIDSNNIDIDPDDAKNDDDLADWICDELGIAAPKKSSAKRRAARDDDDDDDDDEEDDKPASRRRAARDDDDDDDEEDDKKSSSRRRLEEKRRKRG